MGQRKILEMSQPFLLLLSLEWVSSEVFTFRIWKCERWKEVSEVTSTLETKRNQFSFTTRHLKKMLPPTRNINCFQCLLCSRKKKNGLKSQGNTPEVRNNLCQRALPVLLKNFCLFTGSRHLSENTGDPKGDVFQFF